MAITYVSVPALAAAAGIYLFDTHIRRDDSKAFRGIFPVSVGGILAKAKKDLKNSQLPKLAPQFDGLNSFETLVGHK